MKRISSLDTLRGIALLMVIALHCEQSISTIDPIKRLVNMSGLIASYGDLGVPLFFIVSGYTMMLTFGDRARKEVVYAFYIRRFFRIAPLFWLAGACYLIKTGLVPSVWAPNGIRWQEILLTFSFLHWLTPQAFNSVVPGGWSIAVEMQFYLIFPFFAYIAIKKQYKSIALYALIALIHVLVFTYGNALVYAGLHRRFGLCRVVCVSLQPIPEVYNLFDQVVLLQEGHAVYAGPRTGAFRGVVVVK